MRNIYQIIDVYSSLGDTVLVVWDINESKRKTIKLPGDYLFEIGQMLEYDTLPNAHVELKLLTGSRAVIYENLAVLPVNLTITVQKSISL